MAEKTGKSARPTSEAAVLSGASLLPVYPGNIPSHGVEMPICVALKSQNRASTQTKAIHLMFFLAGRAELARCQRTRL